MDANATIISLVIVNTVVLVSLLINKCFGCLSRVRKSQCCGGTIELTNVVRDEVVGNTEREEEESGTQNITDTRNDRTANQV